MISLIGVADTGFRGHLGTFGYILAVGSESGYMNYEDIVLDRCGYIRGILERPDI